MAEARCLVVAANVLVAHVVVANVLVAEARSTTRWSCRKRGSNLSVLNDVRAGPATAPYSVTPTSAVMCCRATGTEHANLSSAICAAEERGALGVPMCG